MVVEIPLIKKCLQNAIKGQLHGDSIDWLSYYGTTWLFWFFALLTSAKQYFGSPIQCFTPAEFGKSWENYAETYCFINNIYKLPMEQEFPDPADRKDQISYYRWVPLILLCQGCSFYLINALWEFLNKKSVINCEEIVKDAQTCTLKEKNRQTKLENISQYIFDTFRYEFPLNGRFYNNGYCTATFYLLTKFLNLINCCFNLFLLESFLGTQLLKYGLNALINFFGPEKFHEHSHFPRVIMCDFNIRTLANQNNKTVQCVLMMNMINEKIFLFFYFWLCFVATVTFINLCYHFAIFFIPFYQTEYVFLNSSKKNKNLEFDEFSQQFLKSDGILLVKFIRQNAGGRITSEIINDVFEKYLALPKFEKQLLSPSKHKITYKSNGELLPNPEIVHFEETPKRKFLQDLPLLSASAYV